MRSEAYREDILSEHLGQGQQHGADPNRDEGDLLEEDPVTVSLDQRGVGQEARNKSAQSRANANTHDQLGSLLSVLLIVGVQGDLLGEHWQVTVWHEVSKESEGNGESPDYKSLVPPVWKVDEALEQSLYPGGVLPAGGRGRRGEDGQEGEGAEYEDGAEAGHELEAGGQLTTTTVTGYSTDYLTP